MAVHREILGRRSFLKKLGFPGRGCRAPEAGVDTLPNAEARGMMERDGRPDAIVAFNSPLFR
jgi:hypothetical protein